MTEILSAAKEGKSVKMRLEVPKKKREARKKASKATDIW